MKTKKTKVVKKRVVKAWVCVQTDMLDSMPFAKIFSHANMNFSEAIYNDEEQALKYSDKFKSLKMKVIPCEIHYKI